MREVLEMATKEVLIMDSITGLSSGDRRWKMEDGRLIRICSKSMTDLER